MVTAVPGFRDSGCYMRIALAYVSRLPLPSPRNTTFHRHHILYLRYLCLQGYKDTPVSWNKSPCALTESEGLPE